MSKLINKEEMKELIKKIQDFQIENYGSIRSTISINVHTDFFVISSVHEDNIISSQVYSFYTKAQNRKAVNNFIKEVNKYEHKIRK